MSYINNRSMGKADMFLYFLLHLCYKLLFLAVANLE